jgi:hypothetical protein
LPASPPSDVVKLLQTFAKLVASSPLPRIALRKSTIIVKAHACKPKHAHQPSKS